MKNRQKRIEQARAWNQANPERRRAISKAWDERNPGAAQARRARRAQRERDAPGHHTRAEWLALLSAHHWTCAYCNANLTRPCKDHIIPLSRGGSHDISNILPACRRCNSSKRDRDVAEFIAQLAAPPPSAPSTTPS
ncbi:HNH endonuclease [Deinococcus kurensis]|uniref:HNH endonuclease n=1 Tax=Deinococcus kurensis TaxID=2662757 RepID=UPI00192E5C6F|nr:HNH endonuclease [Deinococcus kurensis]